MNVSFGRENVAVLSGVLVVIVWFSLNTDLFIYLFFFLRFECCLFFFFMFDYPSVLFRVLNNGLFCFVLNIIVLF